MTIIGPFYHPLLNTPTLTLKMEAVCFSETFLSTYKSKRRHITQKNNIDSCTVHFKYKSLKNLLHFVFSVFRNYLKQGENTVIGDHFLRYISMLL
jgi:hypothetical protein